MSVKQADLIYEDTYRRIVEGQLKPHTRLVERDLATDFQCSRVPAREAIQRLHQDGLLEARSGWGAYVRHLSREEWNQAMQVRSALEGLAFATIAELRPKKALDRMAEIVRKMRESAEYGNTVQSDRSDLQFHEVLVKATSNQFLIEVYPRVATPMILVACYQAMNRETLIESADAHSRIIDVLRSGDVEAARQLGEAHKPFISDPETAQWEKPELPQRKTLARIQSPSACADYTDSETDAESGRGGGPSWT
jgi:DNA-binding GntR family transcriptional regulator